MKLTRFLLSLLLLALLILQSVSTTAAPRWSVEKANAWSKKTGWLVGCNFTPSTAINQLEMWQADTFDPTTIDRELGWAENLGFNSIRVFLHNLLWDQDAKGLEDRMEQFLKIADKHHIGVMFVLLDSCWDPYPKLGKQRDPKPHVHNSGWVQAPGRDILTDPTKVEHLKGYVQGILRKFGRDRRIHAWDLVNEPDNSNGDAYGAQEPPNKPELGFMLLKKVYGWAREANPDQPLTAGVWLGDWYSEEKMAPWNRYMLEEADIITYHNYSDQGDMATRIGWLKRYNRPILCTEYMARPVNSIFQNILPLLKDQNVGAYNWGFVDGKTQTIYPWDSWKRPYTAEPPLWFHDILHRDGTPYKEEEVRLIRQLTGKEKAEVFPHVVVRVLSPLSAPQAACTDVGSIH